MSFFWVFIGGGIGALLRFVVGKTTSLFYAGVFPLATLLANVISCVLFGLLVYKYPNALTSNSAKLFFVTGVCGGFSTFSTFSFETFELLKNGQWPWAVANVLVSVLACLVILYLVYKAQ